MYSDWESIPDYQLGSWVLYGLSQYDQEHHYLPASGSGLPMNMQNLLALLFACVWFPKQGSDLSVEEYNTEYALWRLEVWV